MAENKKLDPPSSQLFDWIVAILSTIFTTGAYIDGWAHHHLHKIETFFTPWHAMLYGGFFITALFLVGSALWNYRKGHSLKHLLPTGYMLSLVGVGIFVVGGIGDMFWHILFGIEANIDALYSPTHLLLALGAFLIFGGPLRNAFAQKNLANKPFFAQLPMLLSLTLMFSILTFMTQLSHPFVNVYGGNHYYTPIQRAFEDEHARGIESIMLQAGIFIGFVLYVLKRIKLPPGSFAVILTGSTIFLAFLEDHYLFIPMALAAGILIDVLYIKLHPTFQTPAKLRSFAFFGPVIIYTLYFATIIFTEGTHWTIHMVFGSIVLSGIVGYLLGLLVS